MSGQYYGLFPVTFVACRAFPLLIRRAAAVGLAVVGPLAGCASAQVADDNAVTSAADAFGTQVGRESLGLYGPDDVRGFSPNQAGNVRVEGLYFDQQGFFSTRLLDSSTIKVGPSVQGYFLPAPTGIVDYTLVKIGDKAVLSPLLSAGPFSGYGASLDVKLPIDPGRLGVSVSVGAFREVGGDGTVERSVSAAGVLRFRPAPHVSITSFYGTTYSLSKTARPIYLPQGNFLPAQITRGRFPGPDDTAAPSISANGGVIARAELGRWSLAVAGFRSLYHFSPNITNLVLVEAGRQVRRQVVGSPTQRFASLSGETRLSRTFDEGPRKHLLLLSLRGREVNLRYGGGETVELGRTRLNAVLRVRPPRFGYGPITSDQAKQVSIGLSYGLAWDQRGTLTVGLQHSHYNKVVNDQGSPASNTSDVWLPSVSATINVARQLAVYGSAIRGLEDAGSAPAYAANANQVLSANLTQQQDLGLVYHFDDKTTLILGYFDVRKPYVALDRTNAYRVLGLEDHTGYELSITGSPVAGLSIVGGAAIINPQIRNATSSLEAIGKRPVGQSTIRAQLNADYTLRPIRGMSVDSSLNYVGKVAGTLDNSVTVPSRATVNLGARYHLALGKLQTTIRIEVDNVANSYSYYVLGSGAYVPISGRSIFAYIASDF